MSRVARNENVPASLEELAAERIKLLRAGREAEQEAGSDAGATKTRAEARNGRWVINGAKQFITNSGTDISAGVTITAVTGRAGDNGPELSAVMVPTGTPGYH